MKRNILNTVLLAALLLPACEREQVETAEKFPVSGTTEPDAYIPGLLRVKVSEDMAEKLLASRDEDGNIIRTKALGDEMDGCSISSMRTSFLIGGPFEAVQRKSGLHLWFDAEVDSSSPVTRSAAVLESAGWIESAEPVLRVKPQSVSMNDPYYSRYQWHYDNTGQFGFRKGIDMKLQEAWDNYGIFGNDQVIVAIIDGGVQYDHPDLKDNMWVNEDEIPGNGKDDDGNGYRDDVYGYNFVTNGAINPEVHGTHVAGTVAAVNNNGIGVCGVAGGRYPDVKGVKVMSVQIMDEKYPDTGANILRAFQYAAQNGAVIAQNSWGYEKDQNVTSLPPSVKTAIDYFIENAGMDATGKQTGPMKGGLVVFAAGNDAMDLAYPAAYDKVISVAAIGPYGTAAYYTNYGSWVTVCAPGGDLSYSNGGVYSTVSGGAYGGLQGTSMACPHVSGLAALVLSASGGEGYTADELFQTIKDGTDPSIYDYNPKMRGQLGTGMINAMTALSSLNTEAPQPVSDLSVEVKANSLVFTSEVPSDDGGKSKAMYLNVYYSTSPFTSTTLSKAEKVQFSVNGLEDAGSGKKRYVVKGLKFNTLYYYSITASDFARNESAATSVTSATTGSNTAPYIEPVSEGAVTVRAWEDYKFRFRGIDPDDHIVTVTYDGQGEAGLSIEFDSATGEGSLNIHAPSAREGSHTCILKIKDEYGASSNYELKYTVLPNSVPEIAREIESFAVNGVGGECSLNVSDYFTDADGEPLQVSAAIADRKILACTFEDGVLTFVGRRIGVTPVRVIASDAKGASVTSSFEVLVRDDSNPMDVYPNPAVDYVNIRTGEDMTCSVKVYSSTGMTVFSASGVSISLNSPLKIDISNAASGVYTVVLESSGKKLKSSFSKK